MWISKLELQRFKAYKSESLDFPAPRAGKNIILVGGMNGFGKTTILEAIYLCCYGKDAVPHLARAGLKLGENSAGYPSFLERAFNKEAARESSDNMSISIVIHKNQTHAIEIKRRWYFRSNGNWSGEEETIVKDIVRGDPGLPRVDGKNNFFLSDIIDEFFVPAHIAPFFLFDGEEVKKLADQDRVEQVKMGLEGLLGVVILRTLSQRLKNFESNKRQEVKGVDREKVFTLEKQILEKEEKLTKLSESSLEVKSRLDGLKDERKALIERLTSAGGGGGDISSVKELVEEREQIRNAIRTTEKALEEMLAIQLPFFLVGQDVKKELKAQLEAELRLSSHQRERASLEPRQQEFLLAFEGLENPIFEPELTNSQKDSLRVRLREAWASLFFPPPSDCAESVIHEHLNDSDKEHVLKFLDGLSLAQNQIQEAISAKADHNERIEVLSQRIARLEGVDKDGTINLLKSQLEANDKAIDAAQDESLSFERQMAPVQAQLQQERATFESMKKDYDTNSPIENVIQRSELVRAAIDELIPALFPLKVRDLGRTMTRVYKELAHKDMIGKIEIGENGETKILSKSGKEIVLDRSAGENQIFATCLIAALGEISGIKAPLVVDTPLGRLDSKHRENILRFWTSNPNRQVILLSQDKEIDKTYYLMIKDSISKIYLLEHVDVGEGVGRTKVREGQYFEEIVQ